MANVTITTTDLWLQEIWSPLILETFDKSITLGRFADRSYEKFARNGGDTIRVPAIARVTVRTLTNMTGQVTFDAATAAATTNIVINTHAYHAFKVDEASVVLNYLPLLEMYTKRSGVAVAEKVDTDLGAALDDTTNEKGTDNVPLTDDVILDSRLVLKNNDVPHDDIHFVVSPSSFVDMVKVDKYINSLYQQVGRVDQGAGRGPVAHLYDFDVSESSNLPAGTNGKKNFMFHRTGFALVMAKEIGIQRREPHDEIAVAAIVIHAIYGVKLMAAARVVEVAGT